VSSAAPASLTPGSGCLNDLGATPVSNYHIEAVQFEGVEAEKEIPNQDDDVSMRALDAQEPGPAVQVESPSLAAEQTEATNPRGPAATFTRNSTFSVGRLFVSSVIGFVLPSYLTHKLPVKTYAAWVLVLQVSAYVGYLDFGLQAGISKYVAEYDAKKDMAGSSVRASAGMALMLIASVLGTALTLILAWRVPQLFRDMPVSLYHDVRLGIVFVGISLSFGLFCSIFSSIFLGLQRYAAPMILALVNRLLFAVAVVASVTLHQSLAVMGALVAAVNLLTGLMQFEAWRRMAKHVRLSLYGLDWAVVKKMLGYCFTLAIWTAAMLCISGLDVMIVGRYDFGQTAFYSIATLPTSFMISIMTAALAPLVPTASALSVHRTPGQMGALLSRVTRYASIILITSGLPLLVAGYGILRIWVGPTYAVHTIEYMRILVLANILRNVSMPYASMLIATESQRIAIGGAIAEAIVNVACSVYLASHIGAIGVAYGTLLGAFVCIGVNFTLNMHYTYSKFAISRIRLFFSGLVRPAVIMIPSVLLVPYWWSSTAPVFAMPVWLAWGLSTLSLVWFASLNAEERRALVRFAGRRLNPRKSYN
jgi:O-antigen/teichoic acid export membrane protein